MSLYTKALEKIDINRTKKYNCIPFAQEFSRFADYLPGVQQGRYYLLSGTSGSGKSQLTDEMFLFNPYEFLLSHDTGLKLKVFYYSLEMDAETKMHQWMARRLYRLYGIRTSVDILQSIGKNRVNENIFEAVKETRAYFEKLEDTVKIYDGAAGPGKIIEDIKSYASTNGETNKDGYAAYDPNEYVIIIVDHVSLLDTGKESIKTTIEKLSSAFVRFRNLYNYTPVIIQQQNAEKENVEHYKVGKLEPSKDGLAESKLTYNDADVALGIFQPQKHEIKTYRGYNILEMGDSYRNLSIFKQRFGVSNVNKGLYFDGAVNYFQELPTSLDINSNNIEAIKKRKPNW